ncbi:UNVERIFIED_CONTAM: hypothetical protein HDU68_010994 [Siphonaria sp. JEL0065]|nr:hypothetical protein HDU68_010994 [Siphonaria sp. JEL0065]
MDQRIDIEKFGKTDLTAYYSQARMLFQRNTPDAKLAKTREAHFDQVLKIRHNFPNFERLDADPGLLGFTNGVYDLTRAEFRPSTSTDYISITCGYAFPDGIDSKILLLNVSTFNGSWDPVKQDELFHIFTSGTRNGKSGITGNDDIVARPLYGDVTTFKPSHSLVLLCNGIPEMDEQDAAVLTHSVVIPFRITFVKNPDPADPKQQKIDKTLKSKIKDWGPQMMMLLTEWYKDYKLKALRKTQVLKNTTTEYAEEVTPHYIGST